MRMQVPGVHSYEFKLGQLRDLDLSFCPLLEGGALLPPIFRRFKPHFPFYDVVSVTGWVVPQICRHAEILEIYWMEI